MSNLKNIRYSEVGEQDQFLKRFSNFSSTQAKKHGRPEVHSLSEYLLIKTFPEIEKELWIVEDDQFEIVAKIGVNLLLEEGKLYTVFGFFDIDLEHKDQGYAFSLLLEEISKWARKNKSKNLVGPMNFNTWFSNRFKVKGFDHSYAWEPHNPYEYYDLFIKNDFEVDKVYLSKFYSTTALIMERTLPGYEHAKSKGYSFRGIDVLKDVEVLYKLNTKCFAQNYLYSPITIEQYRNTHIRAISGTDLSLSFFIMDAEEVERGYVYAFENNGFLIIKTILIDPEARGASLSSAMLYESLKQATQKGISKTAGALVREGNISEQFFKTLGEPLVEHRYNMLRLKMENR